jgi:hypothetical protein
MQLYFFIDDMIHFSSNTVAFYYVLHCTIASGGNTKVITLDRTYNIARFKNLCIIVELLAYYAFKKYVFSVWCIINLFLTFF